jgi:hypothetical protein
MFGWLYGHIVGVFCRHKWNIIYQGHTKTSSGLIDERVYHLQCENCGNIKQKWV